MSSRGHHRNSAPRLPPPNVQPGSSSSHHESVSTITATTTIPTVSATIETPTNVHATQGTTKYKVYNPDLSFETGLMPSPPLFREVLERPTMLPLHKMHRLYKLSTPSELSLLPSSASSSLSTTVTGTRSSSNIPVVSNHHPHTLIPTMLNPIPYNIASLSYPPSATNTTSNISTLIPPTNTTSTSTTTVSSTVTNTNTIISKDSTGEETSNKPRSRGRKRRIAESSTTIDTANNNDEPDEDTSNITTATPSASATTKDTLLLSSSGTLTVTPSSSSTTTNAGGTVLSNIDRLNTYLDLVDRMYYNNKEIGASNNEFSLIRRTTLGMLTSPLRITYSPLDKWSPLEIARFESALCLVGKCFSHIAHAIGTNKTTEDVIEFYYYWKQTKHYSIWRSTYTKEENGNGIGSYLHGLDY